MSEDWPVEFEGFEFAPIPDSWLDHRHAKDRDRYGGPRLFAVSAATYGRRTLVVRYGHPQTGDVLQLYVPAQEHNGGIIPEGLLTGEGWSRSLDPPPGSDPNDVLRAVEENHLSELWADRLDLPARERQQRLAVADGGGR